MQVLNTITTAAGVITCGIISRTSSLFNAYIDERSRIWNSLYGEPYGLDAFDTARTIHFVLAMKNKDGADKIIGGCRVVFETAHKLPTMGRYLDGKRGEALELSRLFVLQRILVRLSIKGECNMVLGAFIQTMTSYLRKCTSHTEVYATVRPELLKKVPAFGYTLEVLGEDEVHGGILFTPARLTGTSYGVEVLESPKVVLELECA